MAANLNDYFKKTGASTVTTLAAPGKALAASSITVGSTTNYPTDTGIVVAIRVVDTAGELVAGTYTEWNATVTSGTTLALDTTPVYGSDQVYAAGSTTQVFIPVSSAAHNDLIDGIGQFANQDGTLLTAPVQAALGVTSLPSGGWDVLNSGTAPTVGTGKTLGNRSFDLTFSSVDLSSTLSPGMRIKLDRNTTPSTQCADFESSSSQYASKSSPSGITFTDDFTCEAWVKLESYVQGGIVTRRDSSTAGWSLALGDSGQIVIGSLRIASNNRFVTSYQSIPLGKWVHIAATMNNSTNTHTIYIDGVSVPFSVSTNGTITALVQAGDVAIGRRDASGYYFDGEISDVRVWSAIRTQTEIQDNMYQALVGNETGLVGYWKLNGDFTDETSNANDLTASGGVVATTADNPFNATEYGVITKVELSGSDTLVNVFTPEGYGIPNETLTNPFYSTQDTPFGFPRDKGKWTVESLTGARTQSSPSAGTWYNLGGSLSVPTGGWRLRYSTIMFADDVGAAIQVATTISTANNTNSLSPEWTIQSRTYKDQTSVTVHNAVPHSTEGYIDTSTITPYYLNASAATSGLASIVLGYSGSESTYSVIKAECAYI